MPDVNHEYGSGHNKNNTSMMFNPIHCAISIVGNLGHNELVQYWWGVTPDLICFPKGNPRRTVYWTLDVRGIVSDKGGVWANAGWNDNGTTGGIVMKSGWNPAWGTPVRDGDKYKLEIPPGTTISTDTKYGYNVNWQVDGKTATFDPELEVGED
jgi:hypothetical protein